LASKEVGTDRQKGGRRRNGKERGKEDRKEEDGRQKEKRKGRKRKGKEEMERREREKKVSEILVVRALDIFEFWTHSLPHLSFWSCPHLGGWDHGVNAHDLHMRLVWAAATHCFPHEPQSLGVLATETSLGLATALIR
jgi:hypothetical protein